MSENLPTTVPVPRIIPPHPRYPRGGSKARKAGSSEMKVGAADTAVEDALSGELGSGVVFSEQEDGGVSFAEPVSPNVANPLYSKSGNVELGAVAGGIEETISAAKNEEGSAVKEASVQAKNKEGEVSWIKKQRMPKEDHEETASEEIWNDEELEKPEEKSVWRKLKGREHAEGEPELELDLEAEPKGATEVDEGPEIESWVDGEAEEEELEEIQQMAEATDGPSVRAGDGEVAEMSGRRRPHFASKAHFVAAIGMACILTLGVWVFWQADGGVPEDTELTPVVSETLQPNPVHTQLSHFLMRFRFDTDFSGMSGWKDYDTETLAELLKKNGSGLELILSCLAAKEWQPDHPSWRSGNLGGDLPWSDLARVKQAEALYLQRRGLEVAAFRSAFDLMEFGRKVQEVAAWPNYFLTGLDIYHRGLETVEQLVDDTRMNSAQLGALQRTFAAHHPPGESDLVTFYQSGYGLEKAILEGESAPARPGTFSFHVARPEGALFKPNRTLALFADAFTNLISDASKPHFQRTLMDLTDSLKASILDSNRTGQQYFAKAMMPYLEISEKQALSVAHYEAVKTLFALRRHGLDVGRLPDTLADLGTKYLKAVPSDPFDGDSLRYSRYRKVVYSTGVDRIDSGGNPGRAGFLNRDEPTLEIPFSTGGDSEFH